MNKEFIPYEQALALKELMISVECMAYYNNGILKIHQDGFRNCKNIDFIAVFNDEKLCAAPLYQQAFRWFREKHNLHIGVCHAVNGKFDCWTNNGNLLDEGKYTEFNTYEEAEQACLKKLIEIVKNKII
jgi:hypothetical protein